MLHNKSILSLFSALILFVGGVIVYASDSFSSESADLLSASSDDSVTAVTGETPPLSGEVARSAGGGSSIDSLTWSASDSLAATRDTAAVVRGETAGDIAGPELPDVEGFVPVSMDNLPAAHPLDGVPMVAPPEPNSMGTAELSYPIEIPKGRRGMQPELTLSYSSAAGNGILGMGWSIPESRIEVNTKYGVPRYDFLLESEAYTLDGSELVSDDVVSGAIPSESYVSGSGTWTQRNTAGNTLFHERNDEPHRRIIRYGILPTGYTWIVTDRHGTMYFYGTTQSSTASSPELDPNAVERDERGNIAVWHLTKIRDTYGNEVLYYHNYDHHDKRCYIDSISYTHNPNGSVAIYNILLSYAGRNDVYSSARYGFMRKTSKQLCNIKVFGYNNKITRAYYFGYDASITSGRLLLKDVIKLYNPNPDSLAMLEAGGCDITKLLCGSLTYKTLVGERTQFDYNAASDTIYESWQNMTTLNAIDKNESNSLGVGGQVSVGCGYNVVLNMLSGGGTYDYSQSANSGRQMLMDIDGNGLTDIIYCGSNGNVYYRPQRPDGTFGNAALIDGIDRISESSSETHSGGPRASFSAYIQGVFSKTDTYVSTYFSDVNADGLPDLVTDGGVYFCRLNGQGVPYYTHEKLFPDYQIITTDSCRHITYTGEVNTNLTCKPIRWVRNVIPLSDFLKPEYRAELGFMENHHNFMWLEHGNDSIEYYYYPTSGDFQCPTDDSLVPTTEAIRVWCAPNSGSINIYSSAALVEDTMPSRQQSRTADGVRLIVQKVSGLGNNDTVFTSYHSQRLKTIDISAGNYAVHHDTVSVTISASDLLLFRLKSGENHRYDAVNWTQEIELIPTQPPFNMTTYHSSRDFLCAGNTSYMAPDSGVVQIDIPVTSFIHLPSDWITVNVLRNDTLIHTAQTGAVTGHMDVQTHQMVYTQSSPLHYTDTVRRGDKISINALVSEGDEQMMVAPRYSRMMLKPSVALRSGSVVFPPVYPSVILGDSSRFGSNRFYNHLFGSMYKGWGSFGYVPDKSHDADTIDLGRVRYSMGIAAQELATADTAVLHQSILDFDVDDFMADGGDALIDTFMIDNNLYNPNDSSNGWLALTDNSRLRHYRSYDQSVTVNGTRMSNSSMDAIADLPRASECSPNTDSLALAYYDSIAIAARRTMIVYDSPIPQPTINNPNVKTVRRHTRTHTKTLGYGVSIPFGNIIGTASLGTSETSTETETLVDYMDLNGDGFPDVISDGHVQYTTPSGGLGNMQGVRRICAQNTVAEATGASAGLSSRLTERGSDGSEDPAMTLSGGVGHTESLGITKTTYADLNGDGLPDIIDLDSKTVRWNVGYSFTDPDSIGLIQFQGNWSTSDNISGSVGGDMPFDAAKMDVCEFSIGFGLGASSGVNHTKYTMADVDGDGRPDILFSDTTVHVFYNRGRTFAPVSTIHNANIGVGGNHQVNMDLNVTAGFTLAVFPIKFTFGIGGVPVNNTTDIITQTLADMNGDGLPDLLRITNGMLQVAYNRLGSVDLLKKVTNPTGGTLSLQYSLSEPDIRQPHRSYNLTGIRQYDPLSNNADSVCDVSITYSTPHYNRNERDFYGYAVVNQVIGNSATNDLKIISNRFYNTTYLNRGRLRSTTYEGDHRIYLRETHSLEYGDRQSLTPKPYVCADYNLIVLHQTDSTIWYDANMTDSIVSTKRYEYDRWHNITVIEDFGDTQDAADTRLTRMTYAADTVRHILDKRTGVTLSDYLNHTLRYSEYLYNDEGDVSNKKVYYNDSCYSETQYKYDSYGMLYSVQFPPNADSQQCSLAYDYDTYSHQYPSCITDHRGYATIFTRDYTTGAPTDIRYPNGSRTWYNYDKHDRLESITLPREDMSGAPYTVSFTYYTATNLCPDTVTGSLYFPYARTRRYDVQHVNQPITSYLMTDAWGRTLQTVKNAYIGGDSVWIYSDVTQKDVFSRVIKTRQPLHLANLRLDTLLVSNNIDERYEYDGLDRLTLNKHADSTAVNISYMIMPFAGQRYLTSITTDERGNSWKQLTDVFGNVKAAVKPDNATTSFVYNAANERMAATDPDSLTTTYVYDYAGRLAERRHPDEGRTSYGHDKAGNVTMLIKNSNDTIVYTYDYERLTDVSYSTFPQNNVSLTYGGTLYMPDLGKVIQRSDASGWETFEYDLDGNVTRQTTYVQTPVDEHIYGFTMQYSYDSFRRMMSMTYPDGEVLQYLYAVGGELSSINSTDNNILKIQEYNDYGQLTNRTHGNNVITQYNYDLRHRICRQRIHDGVFGFDIMDKSCLYDNTGNFEYSDMITDYSTFSGEVEGMYYYDTQNRLVNYEMYDEWTDSIYECPMTYTPAGRLLTSGRSRFGYGNSHKPMCVYDTVSNYCSNLFWTADGQLRQQRRATAGPERINTYNTRGQLAMSLYDDGEQKTFGYYGYDGNGTRKYKITGKLSTTQNSQNPVVYTGIGMTPGEITVYPNPYIVLDNKGATKYYYAGTERIASNVMCKPEYIISQTSDDEHIYDRSHKLLQATVDSTVFHSEVYQECLHGVLNDTIWTEDSYGSKVRADYTEWQTRLLTLWEEYERWRTLYCGMYYYHGDHLGSATWITDANGLPVQYILYDPWGGQFANRNAYGSSGVTERYTFTGKEFDEETKYYNFEARQYDHWLRIFTAPDPLSDQTPDISPYAYCNWNPLRYIDPTGKKIVFAKGSTKEQIQDFYSAVIYLNKHRSGGRYGQLLRSDVTYTVAFTESDNVGYNPQTKTITWNPNLGVETDNEVVLSPSTVLNHEFTHATHHDDAYHAYMNMYNQNPEKALAILNDYYDSLKKNDTPYTRKDDEIVIKGIEQRTALRLGEIKKGQVTRTNHSGKFVIVSDVTSTIILNYFNDKNIK